MKKHSKKNAGKVNKFSVFHYTFTEDEYIDFSETVAERILTRQRKRAKTSTK